MAAPMRSGVVQICLRKSKNVAANAALMTFGRLMSMRKRVSEVLSDTTSAGQELEIKGWVNGIRSHKDLTFLHVTDGSCITPLQVLASPELTENVTYGSSVEAKGRLQASPASGQSVELLADTLHVIGPCDTLEFPLKARERHTMDYTRGFPHLRHRTRLFGALLRARNSATMAIHQYYQRNGYCLVNTPVITSNDAEGAGEVFTVQPAKPSVPSPRSDDDSSGDESTAQFFGHPAYLSVSGQLHLEALSGGLSKVYTFGPTFRAENSRGRHHLCEFYMVEAELAFTETLDDILTEMESLVKGTMRQVLADSPEEVAYFHGKVAPGHCDVVDRILSSEFQRLSYKDAVKILEEKNDKFQFKVSWGCDLHKEHEHYLVSYFNNNPVFVTDFPVQLKPFYARLNDDGGTVAAVDLLCPGVGELCGGSLREERYHVLKDKLDRENIAEDFDWYLDVRRFGSVPHGGYGMGFERYLQSLLGIRNIKDTIPYPRWSSNCKM